jgi:hypothetical protein
MSEISLKVGSLTHAAELSAILVVVVGGREGWLVVVCRVTASRAVASALLENVEGGCWWLRQKLEESDVQV